MRPSGRRRNTQRRKKAIADRLDAHAHAVLAARSADEGKAEDVLILDIRRLTDVADYFVIASCDTRNQMRAVADRITEAGKAFGLRPFSADGERSDAWTLLDYGDIIVHLFRPESRRHYDLERLWGDAILIEWRATAVG